MLHRNMGERLYRSRNDPQIAALPMPIQHDSSHKLGTWSTLHNPQALKRLESVLPSDSGLLLFQAAQLVLAFSRQPV